MSREIKTVSLKREHIDFINKHLKGKFSKFVQGSIEELMNIEENKDAGGLLKHEDCERC